jgi:hypothetical protein
MAAPDRPTPPPRPKLGASSKASAPSLRGGKGFIPPTVHRQKVAVERAHGTPIGPPTVEPAAPPTVSTPKVVGEPPMPVAPAVAEAPSQDVPPVEQAAAAAPRVRPLRIPPRPVVEEPAPADEPMDELLCEQQSKPIVDAGDPPAAPSADGMAAPEVLGAADVDDPPQRVRESMAAQEAVDSVVAPADELGAQHDREVEAKRVVPPPAVLPVEIIAAADLPRTPPPVSAKIAAPPALDDVPEPQTDSPAGRRPLLRYYVGGAIGLCLLLLCAFVAGFWVHSYGAIDRALHATTAGQYYWLESSAGAIYFHSERELTPVERQTDVWRMEFGDPYSKKDPPPKIPGAAIQGVTVAHVPGAASVGQVRYVVVSYWLVVIVLSLPGLWWLRRRRHLQEMCRGLRCLRCGYDLRHSPDRCPECGMPNQRALVAAEMRRRFSEQ